MLSLKREERWSDSLLFDNRFVRLFGTVIHRKKARKRVCDSSMPVLGLVRAAIVVVDTDQSKSEGM